MRYEALRELAAGAYLSPTELAKKLGVQVDSMSKHMRVLRDRGSVKLVHPEDGDGRVQHYQIPQRFRSTTDTGRPLLDYGVCVVRF